LTRPPAAISLADIVAALEGPFNPPEESLHDAEGADSDPLTCPIRDAWHLATATMRRILDGMTLEILVDRQREIDRKRAVGSSSTTTTAAPASPPAQVSG